MVVRGDAAGHTAGRGARALKYLHVHQVAPRLHDALCLLPGRSNTSIVNKGGIARTTVPLGSSERQARREECCRRLVRATIGDGRRRDRERAQHVGKRRGRGRLDGAAKLPFRRHKPILGKLPRAASHSHRSGQMLQLFTAATALPAANQATIAPAGFVEQHASGETERTAGGSCRRGERHGKKRCAATHALRCGCGVCS